MVDDMLSQIDQVEEKETKLAKTKSNVMERSGRNAMVARQLKNADTEKDQDEEIAKLKAEITEHKIKKAKLIELTKKCQEIESNNSTKLFSKKSSETSNSEEKVLRQQIEEAEIKRQLMEA